LLVNAGYSYFFPKQTEEQKAEARVTISMESKSVRMGNDPIVRITNPTKTDLVLQKRCPLPPVDISRVDTSTDGTETVTNIIPNDSVLPCTDLLLVKAGATEKVSLASWKYALFQKAGTYEVSLEVPSPTDPKTVTTARFSMTEPGFFTKIFRTFITRPLFNGLIFVASWVPGHNLGIAVLILTILIKLLLLIPNQHALEGQKKLQQLQPRMDEIKKKFPNDATRVQEETMKLWKEMKINPLQSCLPTLLQLPILIGLFYVIRDGGHIAISRHLTYSFYSDLPALFFTTTLFGVDLLKPEIYVMPALLVVLQFIQMKMMMSKKKSKDEIIVKPVGKKSWMPELDQQTIMMYILPFMIGYFAFTFPAAVSIYWAASTLFGIVQQWFVMRKK
jgi:YidC/Oxa1 family membrane protein insertase